MWERKKKGEEEEERLRLPFINSFQNYKINKSLKLS
jgi:hypothetical protein